MSPKTASQGLVELTTVFESCTARQARLGRRNPFTHRLQIASSTEISGLVCEQVKAAKLRVWSLFSSVCIKLETGCSSSQQLHQDFALLMEGCLTFLAPVPPAGSRPCCGAAF